MQVPREQILETWENGDGDIAFWVVLMQEDGELGEGNSYFIFVYIVSCIDCVKMQFHLFTDLVCWLGQYSDFSIWV